MCIHIDVGSCTYSYVLRYLYLCLYSYSEQSFRLVFMFMIMLFTCIYA